MQAHCRGDIPFTLDDLAFGVERDDIRCGHFIPGEFPGSHQYVAVFLLPADVARKMVVVSFVE